MQRLNMHSSTESDLVGVDDVMPQTTWTRNFLLSQGYGIKDNIVYQDNKSAILLEKNGINSSSKRTRHVNCRFYFVADRIKKGELRVTYRPTDRMHGDFHTKPLQGRKFIEMRRIIMNEKYFFCLPLKIKECVEKQVLIFLCSYHRFQLRVEL